MAIPFAAAAIPLITKAGAALKAVLPFLGKKAAVSQLTIPGLQMGAKATAGKKAAAFGARFMNSGAVPRTVGQAVDRFALDALMGGVYGAMTPGDFGDKLIAGTTSAVGGAVGGMALRGAWSPTSNLGIQLAEVGGSVGGDMLANGVSDGLLRMKGNGSTPYEKMAAEQQKELERQIMQNFMSGKGGYPSSNPYVQDNGIA